MRFSRPLILALSTFALLAACSQPTDLPSAELEPQFGTAFDDRGDAVAYDPKRGVSYVAGVDTIKGDIEAGGTVFVRAHTQIGQLTWQWREASFYDPFVSGLSVDDAGNLYLGWSVYSTDGYQQATVVKLSPTGKVLYRFRVDGGYEGISDLEADALGNLYLAGLIDNDGGVIGRYFLRKYGPGGRLLWERLRLVDDEGAVSPGSIATPYDLGVGEDGSLYVAGYTDGKSVLTKYGGGGRTLWEHTVPRTNILVPSPYRRGQLVSVGGGGVYLAVNSSYEEETNRVTLHKYTESGKPVWQRTALPQGKGFIGSLDAGRDGLAYLAGSTTPEGTDRDVFARRYNASGSVQWTFAPRLKGTDEVARGIATRGPANIYLTGVTSGKVNGKNFGGDDAFLIRLNERGQGVWSR